MPLFALFSNIGQRFWSSNLALCFTPRRIFVEDPTPFWYKHVPSALSHVQDYWLLHILGCPAIISNPRLQDGKRLPWMVPSPLAWVALWVSLSIVSFILNLQTCALRRDDLFHKDWFSLSQMHCHHCKNFIQQDFTFSLKWYWHIWNLVRVYWINGAFGARSKWSSSSIKANKILQRGGRKSG